VDWKELMAGGKECSDGYKTLDKNSHTTMARNWSNHWWSHGIPAIIYMFMGYNL